MLPPAVQVPDWQVDAQPEPHGVPFGLSGFEQAPLAGLQTASWHWSAPAQTTGFEPVQAPAWQVSVCVQALPSLHAVPVSGATVQEIVPLQVRVLH